MNFDLVRRSTLKFDFEGRNMMPRQLSLFEDDGDDDLEFNAFEWPINIGHATISQVNSKSILTKTSGFMSEYDYSLNPYSGCSYGCSYCYAAFFARDEAKRNNWGTWVEAKTNAIDVIRRMRTDLSDKTVYMSTVTDPYQPVERRLKLVRPILEELANRGARLVVQTRSPLVTRDLDLFKKFEHVRINMTVSTDSRRVQQAFEPYCAAPNRRLRAITQIAMAGINTSITMTPLLPIEDIDAFTQDLLKTGVQHFVVQPFHADRGKFVAGTRPRALQLIADLNWSDADYKRIVTHMRSRLPILEEGREGFAPE